MQRSVMTDFFPDAKTYPVRHQRYFALSATAAFAAFVVRFLICCASSKKLISSFQNKDRGLTNHHAQPLDLEQRAWCRLLSFGFRLDF